MKIKISATFEGICSVCGKDTIVFSVGDEDTKKVACVCKDCSDKLGDMPTSEVIEKYGKCDEEKFDSNGIRMEGLDKVSEKLEKIKKKDSGS